MSDGRGLGPTAENLFFDKQSTCGKIVLCTFDETQQVPLLDGIGYELDKRI